MSGDAWQAPSEAPAATGFESLELPTRLLVAQQVAMIVARVVMWAGMTGLALVAPETLGPGDALPEGLAAIALIGMMFLGLGGLLLVGLGGVPVWVWWHHRAGSNLRALGRRGEFSPTAHAAWWFVPFANLVMPYRAMTELVHRSNPSDAPSPRADLLPVWWGCWIGGNLLSNLSGRMADLGGLALALDSVASAMLVVAVVSYLRLVRDVAEAQSAVAARVS
jgi:hypothetical protein